MKGSDCSFQSRFSVDDILFQSGDICRGGGEGRGVLDVPLKYMVTLAILFYFLLPFSA